jgi:pimeloyl-ACP methyl ester carboxylesterase
MMDVEHTEPPPRHLRFWEARAIYEHAAFVNLFPWLQLLPAGDGHPVLVFPGLAASDISTAPMRAFLRTRGYAAYGWDLGRNRGLRPGLRNRNMLRLKEIRERHGHKVSLIGWSLGGIFAREVAKEVPDDVRLVITLGSPFKGHPKATRAWRRYEQLAGHSVDEARLDANLHLAPPVPTTSIFSRSDGIVAWQCCMEDDRAHTENVEVRASHLGLGANPATLYVIADRLAQPEGRWLRFDRSGLRRLVYPNPWRGVQEAADVFKVAS